MTRRVPAVIRILASHRRKGEAERETDPYLVDACFVVRAVDPLGGGMRILVIYPENPEFGAMLSDVLKREGVANEVLRSDRLIPLEAADVVVVSLGALSEPEAFFRARDGLAIVVADEADERQRRVLLDRGFDHVLHGDVSVREIAAQVRAIKRSLADGRRDEIGVPPDYSAPVALDPGSRQAVAFGRRSSLTALESKLLSVLMAEPGRVFSNDELMLAVWGTTIGGRSTVWALIRRLRSKVEPHPSNPVLIRTTWGAGYFFDSQCPQAPTAEAGAIFEPPSARAHRPLDDCDLHVGHGGGGGANGLDNHCRMTSALMAGVPFVSELDGRPEGVNDGQAEERRTPYEHTRPRG